VRLGSISATWRLLLLITALALTWASVDAPAASARTLPCAGAGSQFERGSVARLRWRTKCFLNRVRAGHGLPRLRYNKRLRRSARSHARDMVRRRYFAHQSLSGGTLSNRVRRTGYMRRASRWSVGEVLAWRSLGSDPARRAVRAWLRSPGHRALLLSPKFRELGISVVRGVPKRSYRGKGLTFVTHFGRRW
jgi:uncharacterized protein YkwD